MHTRLSKPSIGSIVCENVCISGSLVVTDIGVYDNMADDFFLGLLDWRLVRTIPYIVGSPHVRLDATMTLLYKVILHFGWLLSTDDEPQDVAITLRGMYAECRSLHLIAKAEQLGGSIEALVTLISLVRTNVVLLLLRCPLTTIIDLDSSRKL